MTDLPATEPPRKPLRVLVCGGRDYSDIGLVWATLKALWPCTVIHGAASGADTLAADWAYVVDSPCEEFPADWGNIDRPGAVIRTRLDGTKYDAAAGAIRNQRMIDEGKPDLVVAFPGGRGTADMVRRARAARVEVREIG